MVPCYGTITIDSLVVTSEYNTALQGLPGEELVVAGEGHSGTAWEFLEVHSDFDLI